MIDSDLVYGDLVRRIVRASNPYRVILFGSRGRGDNRPESDVDILVVKDTPEPRHRRARTLYRAVASLPLNVEIIVYTPAEIADWREVPQAFVTTAVREGRVLYGRPA